MTFPRPQLRRHPRRLPRLRKPVEFPDEGGKLTVFAAASLTDAFTKIADDLKAADPNLDITFNFAGSQALVTQIAEGGAQADVLALASPAQMKSAVEDGIPVEGSATFVTNRLTVVVPADNPAGIASVADLAKDGVRLVLANPDVPAGNYARQSLCKTAAAGGPSVEDYAANIVSEEDNVRSVLTKVELGEADAGIVYVTDALTSGDKVQSIEIPGRSKRGRQLPDRDNRRQSPCCRVRRVRLFARGTGDTGFVRIRPGERNLTSAPADKPSHRGSAVPWILGGILVLFLAIPLFALSWRAIAHLDNLQKAGRATVVDALVLSATTSLTSLVVIIGLGTPLAFGDRAALVPGQSGAGDADRPANGDAAGSRRSGPADGIRAARRTRWVAG